MVRGNQEKPEQNSVPFSHLGVNSEDLGISVGTLRVAEVSRPRMPSLDLLELWKWLKSHAEGLSSDMGGVHVLANTCVGGLGARRRPRTEVY